MNSLILYPGIGIAFYVVLVLRVKFVGILVIPQNVYIWTVIIHQQSITSYQVNKSHGSVTVVAMVIRKVEL